MSNWISRKGVEYITSPKRGMATDVNSKICITLTGTGPANWIGSFVSPDIDHLEKSSEIGSQSPVRIVMKNGDILLNDGEKITRINTVAKPE